MRFLPVILFVFFAALAAVMLLHEKPPLTHTQSRPMPTLTLANAASDTQQRSFSDGTVLVNFFASWCAPCLAEHKELMILNASYPHVTLVGIAWNDSAENIDAMLKEHGNPYDEVWFDVGGSSAVALGLRGVPETYIVKNGRIIYHLAGPILPATRADVIGGLLAQ